jgi:hypothetical protein
MAAYGVCLLLVVSFILFEVLDVDGSDFPGPIRSATVLKVADPAQDIRRAPLHSAPPVHGIVMVDRSHAEMLQVQRRVDDASTDRPAHPSFRRALRHMLARGLLAEPAPSA